MLFLKQPLILPFLCHKSATTCQIDSNKVSSSKLESDLCYCFKTGIIESTTPPQQSHKRGTIFWDTLVDFIVLPFQSDKISDKVGQTFL